MEKKRILCYGDSNTWGYVPGLGTRYPDDVRWTGVLRNLLGGGYTVLEDGLNGRTTIYEQNWSVGRCGRRGLDYSLQSQSPLDLVVIMLGTNDLSMTEPNLLPLGIRELSRVARNADQIINAVSPIYRDAPRVLLIAPPPLNVNYDEQNGTVGKYAASLRFPEICRAVADELGLFYLDGSPFAEVGTVDCHMTERGHRQLGEAVAEKVREIFED